jgi:hypothetical protein
MTHPIKFWNGLKYNYATSEIQVSADREGAEVFENIIRGDTTLILSHDKKTAYLEALHNHDEYCESCDGIPCHCGIHEVD